MDYVEVAKAICEIGILAICGAVVVVLFVSMVKKNMQRNDELIQYIKCCKAREHPNAEESDTSDVINEKITEILSYARVQTNADRCYLYLYHNGGRSTSGTSFQRMSCTCEVIAPGILPVASDGQNLHKGSFSTLCRNVREDHKYYVPDVSVLKDTDTMTFYRTQMRHIESLYLRGVRDMDGYTIGFIGLDYCSMNRHTPEELIDSVLHTTTNRISSLVDVKTHI